MALRTKKTTTALPFDCGINSIIERYKRFKSKVTILSGKKRKEEQFNKQLESGKIRRISIEDYLKEQEINPP